VGGVMRSLNQSDARMLALHMVASAKAQETPEYPIDGCAESGRIGSSPPYPRYEWNGDQLTVSGHAFSVRELLDTLVRAVAMANEPPQRELFGTTA